MKWKQSLGAALSVLLLSSAATAVFADGISLKYSPTDIKNHWAYAQLKDLVDQDVLTGYKEPDGTYTLQPNQRITRAEFVQMLVTAVGEQTLEGFEKNDKQFADVPKNQWYYPSIHLLASIGFVNGVDQAHFAPNRNIQRDEMAQMLHHVFEVADGTYPPLTKHFVDIPDGYWAQQAIERLAKAGLVRGYEDGSFKPTANATRAEAATMIFNALHKQEGAPADDNLTNIVLEHEKEYVEKQNDFSALYELNAKTDTGYYKLSEDASIAKIKDAVDKGFTLKAAFKTEPQAKVIDISSYTGTVQLNESIKMTLTKGDFSQTTSLNAKALFSLKKMPDNSWKIYDAKTLLDSNSK